MHADCEGLDPETNSIAQRYKQLKLDFEQLRSLAGDKFFMIYNKIEEYILLDNATPNLNWETKGKASDLNKNSPYKQNTNNLEE